MTEKEKVLKVSNLTVCYGRTPSLWEVNMEIPQGSLAGIIGPNGAGKSTFLKSILNLIPKVSGRVQFFEKTFKEVRHRIAYVPQRESVDWGYPVVARDVVAMGLYRKMGLFQRVGKKEKKLAEESLDRLNMLEYADRQIGELSGGQQQRVFLARALVQQADFYLMDEPFAGIDATTEKVILELLKSLNLEGKTVLCVHHDLPTVAEYFDHLSLLNLRVIASGGIDEVFTQEKLSQCYGGRLDLLSKLTDSLAKLERLRL